MVLFSYYSLLHICMVDFAKVDKIPIRPAARVGKFPRHPHLWGFFPYRHTKNGLTTSGEKTEKNGTM